MKIRSENIPASLGSARAGLCACLAAFGDAIAVERVILFGSQARGDAKRGSDVDLCIVARGVTSQRKAALRLRRAIGSNRNKPALSLIPISPARLAEKQRAHDPFFETVLAEGVCVAEKD